MKLKLFLLLACQPFTGIHTNKLKKNEYIYIYIHTQDPLRFRRESRICLCRYLNFWRLFINPTSTHTHTLSLWALYCHIIRLAMYVRSVLIFPCWLINQAGLSQSLTRTPRYENTKRASFSHPDWSLSGPPNNQRRTNVRGI